MTLARHRMAAFVCAVLAAAAAVLGLAVGPRTWLARADLLVTEPVTVHRLANPFQAVPSQQEELEALPEQLRSKETLAALVKRLDLIDQWPATRPPLQQAVAWALGFVRGAPTDAELLEALVQVLEKRVAVWTSGSHLLIEVRWPEPRVAFAVVQGLVEAAQAQRPAHTLRGLEEGGADLSARLNSKRVEVRARANRIDEELRRAAVEGRPASTEGERAELLADRQRAAELEMLVGDNQIAVDVLRRTNAERFAIVQPPHVPRTPEGPTTPMLALVLALVVATAAGAGALGLSMYGGHAVADALVARAVGVEVLASVPAAAVSAPRDARRAAALLVGALALIAGGAAGYSRGNLVLGLAPLVAALGLWILWVLPLKWPLLGLMLLAVTIDDPTDRPYAGLWASPLMPLGQIFFHNIAWFTGFELSAMGLGLLTMVRRVGGASLWARDPPGPQGPRALRMSLLLSVATIGWLLLLGLARGGVFREALWQFRGLLMVPLIAALALHAFDFPKDLKLLARVLGIGTVVKSCLGAYFIYRVAAPMGADPPHTTGHDDTMIFVTAALVSLLLVWERPAWGHLRLGLAWLLAAGLAMKLNDRRIAYVEIPLAIVVMYALTPWTATKRTATRWLLIASPVVALYVGAGWQSQGNALFAPVVKLKSIVAPPDESEENSSNVERDIENFNILKTWESAGLMFGQGFGHHFREYIPSNDFRQSFSGLIGHNSVLWLLWIGGVFGFTFALLYVGVTLYVLARTLKLTRAWDERVALLAALSVFFTYLLQAFGDMGFVNGQFAFFVGPAVAIVGRLAARRGVLVPAGALAAGSLQRPEAMGAHVSVAAG